MPPASGWWTWTAPLPASKLDLRALRLARSGINCWRRAPGPARPNFALKAVAFRPSWCSLPFHFDLPEICMPARAFRRPYAWTTFQEHRVLLRDVQPASRPHRSDYAKWMLEDPPVNFVISTPWPETRHRPPGHSVSLPDELAAPQGQTAQAEMRLEDEGQKPPAAIRAAIVLDHRSHKAWPGSNFTLQSIPAFSEPGWRKHHRRLLPAARPAQSTVQFMKSRPQASAAKTCC